MTLAERLRAALAEGHARPMSYSHDPRIEAGMTLAPAAVLVAVTDREEPGLILTQRSAALRRHAGQVAFPGGRVDPGDRDIVDAALREAWEEIALPREQVEIVGTSDRYHTFSGFDIVPVIGVIPPDLPLHPHEAEVESLFELPLDYALDPARRVRVQFEKGGKSHFYHEIIWQDRRIWGVTAAILANLAKRLGHEPIAA